MKKVSELLNDQINKELYSAYLYLIFLSLYQEQGLDGFANWYIDSDAGGNTIMQCCFCSICKITGNTSH